MRSRSSSPRPRRGEASLASSTANPQERRDVHRRRGAHQLLRALGYKPCARIVRDGGTARRKGPRTSPSALSQRKQPQRAGKRGSRQTSRNHRKSPANRLDSNTTTAQLKIVVSPVRVRVSPCAAPGTSASLANSAHRILELTLLDAGLELGHSRLWMDPD